MSEHVPVKTLEAAENTPNIVRQPDRKFCTLACIICCRHCKTFKGAYVRIENKIGMKDSQDHEYLDFGYEPSYIRKASRNLSEIWSATIPLSLGNAWQAGEANPEQSWQREGYYDSKPTQVQWISQFGRLINRVLTRLKCSPRISQRFDHSKRILVIL